MGEALAVRQGPLEVIAGPLSASPAVELSVTAPRAKFSLRCQPHLLAIAGKSLGFTPPDTVCRAAVSNGRAALCLGPDEWLLLAAEDDGEAIPGQISVALAGTHFALVDVGHRSL